MAVRRENKIPVIQGTGNVFADLDVPNPEEELAKAQLATLIGEAIKRRRLTQAAAARLAGLDQPKISALVNGWLGGFTIDLLMHCLAVLGQDVENAGHGPGRNCG
jgi:predicted XRE-type DNA-binding protein